MEDVFHLGIKAVLLNEEGKILLLQVNPEKLKGKNTDYWDLPGGRVQKGEAIIDTLRREVEEETGIADIGDPAEIGMVVANIRIPLNDHESAGLILNMYSCTLHNQTITLSDEHIAYDWFTPIKAAELLQVKYPDKFCKSIANI